MRCSISRRKTFHAALPMRLADFTRGIISDLGVVADDRLDFRIRVCLKNWMVFIICVNYFSHFIAQVHGPGMEERHRWEEEAWDCRHRWEEEARDCRHRREEETRDCRHRWEKETRDCSQENLRFSHWVGERHIQWHGEGDLQEVKVGGIFAIFEHLFDARQQRFGGQSDDQSEGCRGQVPG